MAHYSCMPIYLRSILRDTRRNLFISQYRLFGNKSIKFNSNPCLRVSLLQNEKLFGKKHNFLSKLTGNWLLCCCGSVRSGSTKATPRKSSELRRLFQLAKPEKWNLVGAIGLLLISSTVTMALPFCMGKIIDIIYTSPKEELAKKLSMFCQILAAVFVVGGLANFGRFYLMSMSGQRIINRLRTTVYDSILRQEVGFFDKVKTGELVNRLSADASAVGYSVSMNISDGLRSSFAVIAGVGMMVYTSQHLAFVGLTIVPPVALSAVVYGRYLKKITTSVQDSLAGATQVAEEHIANIRTVRAFAQEDRESTSYASKISDVMHLVKKESLARAMFFGMAGLSGNLIVLTVLYYGGTMMSTGEISVGDLASFLMYAGYVGISIGGLSSFYSEMMRAVGASSRLWELVDRVTLIPLTGGILPTNLKGDIQFENITFAYPNRPESAVLRDLTLDIVSGSVVAVVGPSGSGKSTLTALLLRFYDPQKGQITLDGNGIESLDPNWLRKRIGLVSQEPILFSGSIRENIVYGSEDMAPSDDDIRRAAEEANAWEFIEQFPDGLNTLVGERGVMLSGGQRQRVTIARALIKNPKILLLDEATSALDAKSEHLVQEALERLMKGRTVVTIAHRLSTILKADKIAVLDRGQIVELGKYHQLMTIPGGHFRLLMEKQTISS